MNILEQYPIIVSEFSETMQELMFMLKDDSFAIVLTFKSKKFVVVRKICSLEDLALVEANRAPQAQLDDISKGVIVWTA